MPFSSIDHALMARALRLAERGLATTQPNPRVGCVIAHRDEVVGEGWHQRAGGPHAEVFALREAGARARGASVYVTLEPCGLEGRTPACADALIAAGVARVVIASEDAFQRAGAALDRLRAAGIMVETGLLRDAARELNRGFFSRIERGRSWLRVKLAMSLDGRTALANGESKWITGDAARADVQRWRARSSAILSGIGTVLADDPALTVRLSEDAQAGAVGQERIVQPAPLRVVLDRQLRTPRGAQVLDGTAPTLLLHARDAVAGDDRFSPVELAAVETGRCGLDLHEVLRGLAARGMNEVQVEAGPPLCGALFAAGLVDELLLYVAPVMLGERARPLFEGLHIDAMTERLRMRIVESRRIGDDVRVLLRPQPSPA